MLTGGPRRVEVMLTAVPMQARVELTVERLVQALTLDPQHRAIRDLC
jgi:hypothetical protein